MATASFALCNLLTVPARPAPSTTTSKTLILSLTFPNKCRTVSPVRYRRRRSLLTSLQATAQQDNIKAINEDDGEGVGDAVENKLYINDMKTLVQAYKNAILDGDEKSVCELEAAIINLEKEKSALSLKLIEITKEIDSGKKTFVRLKADFENLRKKSEKDRLTFTSDVRGDVVESLLPMVDSFESAKQQIKPETEKEKKINMSYQGIYKQFVDVMRSLSVAVVETVGKPFDPSIHEAVAREESQQFKDGIVTNEIRRGFVLGDRLLRHAVVKVSIGPGLREAAPASESSSSQSK